MTIAALTDATREAWDDFVRRSPGGTFFHLSGWRDVIERTFGFETHYRFEESGGEITGILPLAHVKRPLFGACMMSTPLCVYGGPLGEGKDLLSAAEEQARALNVAYLEVRSSEEVNSVWPRSDLFYTFRKSLAPDEEEILKSIPRKQRAEVRKGIKAGLQVTHGQEVDDFYRTYATSVRDLGTPVFPKKYLSALLDVFGDACEVTTVSNNGRALASVLSFYFKDQVLPYYGGGVPDARAVSAYPYMYWRVMMRAAEKECSVFDFGRSMQGTGAFSFKKNFGFEPVLLNYQYCLIGSQQMPDLTPTNPRNEMVSNVWKRVPLPLANRLGPLLYPVVV